MFEYHAKRYKAGTSIDFNLNQEAENGWRVHTLAVLPEGYVDVLFERVRASEPKQPMGMK